MDRKEGNMSEKEQVLTEDEENNLEVIQNLDSPEKIQAMEEIFNEESSEAPKSEADEENKSEEEKDKVKDKASTVEDKKSEEDKKLEPEETPKAPEKEKAEDKASFEITDEYIEKAPEKDRNLLTSIKGEIISPKALKIYLNAQRLLGKRTQDLMKPEDKVQQINQPQLAEEGEKPQDVKEKLVLGQLKKNYPDLPDDLTEREDYLRELNYDKPLEFQKFVRDRQTISDQVEKDYNQMQYFVNNYEKINNEIINEEIRSINEQFGKMNVEPKDLDIDLSIDEDGNYSTALNSLLLDNTGKQLDVSLFQYVGGKPILKKQSLAVKLFQQKLPDIINLVKVSGRKDGLKAAHDKKTVKTLSGASSGGSEKVIKEDYTPEEIAGITDPDELARIEKSFNS